MKCKKNRCTELLNKVLRRTRTIFYAIQRLGEDDSQKEILAISTLREEMEVYLG